MLIIPALACWLVLLFRLLLLRLPLPLAIFVWINAYLSTYLQHLPCTYETDPSPSPSPGQGPDSETEAQCQRQSPLRFSCPSLPPSLCRRTFCISLCAFPFPLLLLWFLSLSPFALCLLPSALCSLCLYAASCSFLHLSPTFFTSPRNGK